MSQKDWFEQEYCFAHFPYPSQRCKTI
jgi:hypothetical protein